MSSGNATDSVASALSTLVDAKGGEDVPHGEKDTKRETSSIVGTANAGGEVEVAADTEDAESTAKSGASDTARSVGSGITILAGIADAPHKVIYSRDEPPGHYVQTVSKVTWDPAQASEPSKERSDLILASISGVLVPFGAAEDYRDQSVPFSDPESPLGKRIVRAHQALSEEDQKSLAFGTAEYPDFLRLFPKTIDDGSYRTAPGQVSQQYMFRYDVDMTPEDAIRYSPLAAPAPAEDKDASLASVTAGGPLERLTSDNSAVAPVNRESGECTAPQHPGSGTRTSRL